jgi:hypothetical protein
MFKTGSAIKLGLEIFLFYSIKREQSQFLYRQ